MSSNANAAKARLWIDGDAYRAPVGTALPTTNLFTAATFTGWDAFGAIKAGFEVAASQETTKLTAWNVDGPYRKKRGEKITTVTLRPVDQSKATVLSVLRGGSIAETTTGSGVHEWLSAEDEEFALLLIVRDPGFGSAGYLMDRGSLDDIPTEALNDDDLFGYDLTYGVLTPLVAGRRPIRKFTDSNPLITA